MSIHTQGKSHSDLGAVLVLNDPPAWLSPGSPSTDARREARLDTQDQGLTLVHFSAQRAKHFLWATQVHFSA